MLQREVRHRLPVISITAVIDVHQLNTKFLEGLKMIRKPSPNAERLSIMNAGIKDIDFVTKSSQRQCERSIGGSYPAVMKRSCQFGSNYANSFTARQRSRLRFNELCFGKKLVHEKRAGTAAG